MADKSRTDKNETDKPDPAMPPAGPHAKPELTNPDATPGTGSLPDETGEDDADGGVG